MLSDDLKHWFDDELWRVADGGSAGRFVAAVTPEQLLGDAPSVIWPALMPCDFLPILGNGMGDWLCARVSNDNSVSQVVHWYHGGGDWIPWGSCLCEAILFDDVRRRLPGSERDHAIFADDSSESDGPSAQTLRKWALERLAGRVPADIERSRGNELAQLLLASGISEVAVLCQLVIDSLDNPMLTGELVRSWRVKDADHVQRTLFDNQLLTEELIQTVVSDSDAVGTLLSHQDWNAVRQHCIRVTQLAPEIAWGWDLLGYCYERSGKINDAIDCYRCGLGCSIFTDQTVRVRTHGFNGDGQKFSAARLMELGFEPSEQNEREYFESLCTPEADSRRDQVREHFCRLAGQAAPAEAHELWQRAGWDLGAEPMLAFAELLEQVAASAEAAGRTGPSEFAITHRNCFRDRYGI